jgi:hypothetical protein
MPYSAEISRVNPTCFLFLIDRSYSMSDPIGGGSQKKSQQVADALNRLLQSLTLRCAKSEGIRNYFHVGVIGYGESVGYALAGHLAGRDLVAISEVANNPLRIETRTRKVDDGAGGVFDQSFKLPIWFEPVADGGTPMCQALDLAGQTIAQFINQYPGSFPPIVMNLTDGEATDGDPEPVAKEIKRLATSDGNVLLFNLHVSSVAAPALQFPPEETGLPNDRFAGQLFRMSSVLPPQAQAAAKGSGISVTTHSRGFIYNADPASVVQFLDIGTRPNVLR